jgi:hypothetical protein
MGRVQLNICLTAMLAFSFITSNYRIHPLVMTAAAILASGILSVVRVFLAGIPEPAFVCTRLRAKLLI